MLVYGILGFLTIRAAHHRVPDKLKAALAAVNLAGLTAYLDEFNQLLSASRTGSFYDMGLNMVGCILSIIIYSMMFYR